MKARLIKDEKRQVSLLLDDGTCIVSPSVAVLGFLLFNFKSIDNFSLEKGSQCWRGEYPDMVSVPGETLAHITDSNQLLINDITPFVAVFEQVKATVPIEKVLTASEFAEKYGKSVEQIKVFCRQRRIWGATKIGRDWIIPADAPYPVDMR